MSNKTESHIELQFREPGRLQWLGAFYGNEESAWAASDGHRKKYPNDEVRVVRITTEFPDRPDDKDMENRSGKKTDSERICDNAHCIFDLLAGQEVLLHDIEDITKRLESIEGNLAHVDEKTNINDDAANLRVVALWAPCGSAERSEAIRRLLDLRKSENERRRMEEPDSM